MKEDRGCVKDVTHVSYRWQIGPYKLKRCPVRVVDHKIFLYFKAYNFFVKGFLPVDGGWIKQTNKYIEAINYITSVLSSLGDKNG